MKISAIIFFLLLLGTTSFPAVAYLTSLNFSQSDKPIDFSTHRDRRLESTGGGTRTGGVSGGK